MTPATFAMANARSMSIGFSSSLSASSVSNRWLRRSSTLFFMSLRPLPDLSLERAERPDGVSERFRKRVNGIAPHQIRAADELQVGQRAVRAVAVLEHHGVTGGN